jgi:Domain of unknown function (DUF6916)
MPDLLKPGDFQSLTAPLRLSVKVADTVTSIELTVESVKPLPAHRFREAPFSLLLSGPRSPSLPQATYSMQHPRLGSIELFLVPVGQDATSMRYEVTFN